MITCKEFGYGNCSVFLKNGWKVGCINFKYRELDEKEQYYIKQYAGAGYQLRNVSFGGQGEGRKMINETKSTKGYRDGILQGKKTFAKQLSDITSKHLTVKPKEEKQGNKVSQKQLEKFNRMIDENSYKGSD